MKKVLKILLYLVMAVVAYLFLAVVGSLIPMGKKPDTSGEIQIFVQTNGFHTDLVVPLKNTHCNWLDKLDSSFVKYQNYQYAAFGWGDVGFYIKSKTRINSWDVVNALFIPSKTLIQIKFYDYEPRITERRIPLCINEKQYKSLCQFIENQFKTDKSKNFVLLEQGYGANDYFFKAKGKYHLFNTCNNWTSRGLKKMGVRSGLWTPFDKGVMWHLR